MRTLNELDELLEELVTAAAEEELAFEDGVPGIQHKKEVENAKIAIRRLFVSAELWNTCFDRPDSSGWYITWWHDDPDTVTPRYYDATAPLLRSWFIARSNGGSDSIYLDTDGVDEPLVVNMSFDLWRKMPEPPAEITLKDIYHL